MNVYKPISQAYVADNRHGINEVLSRLIHWSHGVASVPIAYCDPDMASSFDTLPAPWFSLFLMIEGEMTFRIKDRSLNACKGELVILNAHFGNAGILRGGRGRYTCLSFDIRHCAAMKGTGDAPLLTSTPVNECHLLHSTFRRLSLCFHAPSPHFPEIHVKAAVLDTLIMLADHLVKDGSPAVLNIGAQVRQAMQFIQEHQANQDLSLTQIASATGISVGHLEKQFRREHRQSPMQFLQHLRMQRARNLLTRTNLDIKAIAYSIGYTDPLYFSKCFRKEHGISPRTFRHQHLKEPPEKGRPKYQSHQPDKESTHETH